MEDLVEGLVKGGLVEGLVEGRVEGRSRVRQEVYRLEGRLGDRLVDLQRVPLAARLEVGQEGLLGIQQEALQSLVLRKQLQALLRYLLRTVKQTRVVKF